MRVNDVLLEDLGNLSQLNVGPMINLLFQAGAGRNNNTGELGQINRKQFANKHNGVSSTSPIQDVGVVKNMAALRKVVRDNPQTVGFALYIGNTAVALALSDEHTLAGGSRYSSVAYDVTAFNDVLKKVEADAIAQHNATAKSWNQKTPGENPRLPNSANPATSARSQTDTRYNWDTRTHEPAPTKHFQGRGIATSELKELFADFELIAKATNQPISCKIILRDADADTKRRDRYNLSASEIKHGRDQLLVRLKKFKLSKKPTAKTIEEFIAMSLNGVKIAQFGGRSYSLTAQTYDKVDPLQLLNGGGFTTRYKTMDPGSYDSVDLSYRYDPESGMLKPYYATWSDPNAAEYKDRKKEAVLDPKSYTAVKLGGNLNDKNKVIKTLLEKFKANQYNEVLMLMNSLSSMGMDYPEFAAIKKSIAVELNKKKEA